MQPKRKKLVSRLDADTQDQGIVYADADFAGGFVKDWTADPNTAKVRSSYFIMWSLPTANCKRKLLCPPLKRNTFVCHNRCEPSLSKCDFSKQSQNASNPSAIPNQSSDAKSLKTTWGQSNWPKRPKLRPRTKHINIKYHHFREAVSNDLIGIEHVDTDNHLADIGTKPLDGPQFIHLRRRRIGW